MWQIFNKNNVKFTLILTITLIICCSRLSNKGEIISKQQGCKHFYVQQIVSNSQILVFYSEKRHFKILGYARNWNSFGYIELHHIERKYRIRVCRRAQCYYLDNVTINDHKSFYMSNRICVDNKTY